MRLAQHGVFDIFLRPSGVVLLQKSISDRLSSQLGDLSQRRFPNRPFARNGADCRQASLDGRSSCAGTFWLTGCAQRPRLGSHVNNFTHCCSTRLLGAATRIPMRKKPIVDLDLQRSRHGGSNAKSGWNTSRVTVHLGSWYWLGDCLLIRKSFLIAILSR